MVNIWKHLILPSPILMSSLRFFLYTVKSSKESFKVSFMIHTNLELSATSCVLLYILLSCVVFTTLLYYKMIFVLQNLHLLCIFMINKVCCTWFFLFDYNLSKLFPTYCFIFYRLNKRAFYFHKGHAQKRHQLSPQNHSNRV